MNVTPLHRWDVTPAEAAAIQRRLRGRLVLDDDLGPVRRVAGADIALDPRRKLGFGGVVVFSFPELVEIERQTVVCPLTFPYVPGLLAFREAPVLLGAFARLRAEPDVVVFDAHGLAHPRRMGLASHLGLVLGTPSIGCAKSVLVGTFDPPPRAAGTWTPLVHEGETVGAAVRTRDGVKPVFVSQGHRISLATAVGLMLRCSSGYRVPVPTREADRVVGTLKRSHAIGV
jgi:deoxyribonuclease V